MNKSERFPFVTVSSEFGEAGMMPYLPLKLSNRKQIISVSGLLDTGATVSVLPYKIGLELGADWDEISDELRLGGNLASYEARPLVLTGVVGPFENHSASVALHPKRIYHQCKK